MAYPGNSSRIPNFIKSSGPKKLRLLMFQKQKTTGKEYVWSTPKYVESEKKWYSWYIEVVEVDLETGKIKEGDE